RRRPTWAAGAARGLVPPVRRRVPPPARPASARSFLARATSRPGHLRLLSKKTLIGGIGVQPGVKRPSHATWFRASRSMLSSNASRTRRSLASGVPRLAGGFGLPVLVLGVVRVAPEASP